MRHQVKSQWYYYFWGAMAVAVVGGQVYVGTGYRIMAEQVRSSVHTMTTTCQPAKYHTPPLKSNKTLEFE